MAKTWTAEAGPVDDQRLCRPLRRAECSCDYQFIRDGVAGCAHLCFTPVAARFQAVTGFLARAYIFTPVVYTCGDSVLQELRRTKAVLGGL